MHTRRQINGSTALIFDIPQGDSDEKVLDMRPWMDRAPTMLFHTTPLPNVVDMFRSAGLLYMLVVRDGKVREYVRICI